MGAKTRKRYYRWIYSQIYSMPNAISSTYKNLGPVIFNRTLDYIRTGDDRPKYQQLISEGKGATNPYDATFTDIWVHPGNVTVRGKYFGPVPIGTRPNGNLIVSNETVGGTSFAFPDNTFDNNLILDAQNAASIAVRKRIIKEQEAFSGLVFLGELRESIKMLRNPAAAAREYTGLFLNDMQRQRRQQSKKKFSKTLADSWLEYSFGMAPLMSDISDIASAANRQFEESIVRLVGRGHAQKALVTTSQQACSGPSGRGAFIR